MHPSANIMARAELHASAPRARFRTREKPDRTLVCVHVCIRCVCVCVCVCGGGGGAQKRTGQDLARSDDFDVLAQGGTDEHLVDEDEPLDERHAQRVAEFGRRSPRPALRPIQSYEIWVYSSGQHGMHDGCELRRVADAELEADWLAVGETCDTSVTLHPNVKPKRLAVVAAVGRQRGE